MTGNSNALMAEVAPISAANANSSYAIRRRVVLAATIGNTLEWYDFLVYGTATALVFNKLFFPLSDPALGTIAAFGTYAVGFLARPLRKRTYFAAPLDRDVWCWRRYAATRRRGARHLR